MNLIIVIALAIILFGLVFLTRRRFGLLGLALGAGATLASLWGYEAGIVLASTGVIPDGQATGAIAVAAITLLPALLLLGRGKKTKKVGIKVTSSLLFVILSLTLLAESLSTALPLDATGIVIYTTLLQYRDVIVSVGLVAALIDILVAKTPKPAPDAKPHH